MNSGSNHCKGSKRNISEHAYLWIKIVQTRYRCLNSSIENGFLNGLSGFDQVALLQRLEVGFLGEFRGGLRVAFHGQVVENQGINVTNSNDVSSAQQESGGELAGSKDTETGQKIRDYMQVFSTLNSERFPMIRNHHCARG